MNRKSPKKLNLLSEQQGYFRSKQTLARDPTWLCGSHIFPLKCSRGFPIVMLDCRRLICHHGHPWFLSHDWRKSASRSLPSAQLKQLSAVSLSRNCIHCILNKPMMGVLSNNGDLIMKQLDLWYDVDLTIKICGSMGCSWGYNGIIFKLTNNMILGCVWKWGMPRSVNFARTMMMTQQSKPLDFRVAPFPTNLFPPYW